MRVDQCQIGKMLLNVPSFEISSEKFIDRLLKAGTILALSGTSYLFGMWVVRVQLLPFIFRNQC